MTKLTDQRRHMTPIIARYIIQRIAIPFVSVLMVILMALSMERTLRLIEEIALYNAPLSGALQLLFYLLPHYLGLALPAALFIAVLLGVRRLHENSELVAIHSTGQSLQSIWIPILALSLIVSIALFAIVSYAQPYARYAYRAYFQDLKSVPVNITLRPGIFQKFGTQSMIRVDRFNPENGAIQGFFATHENARGERTIISAETGVLEKLPNPEGFIIHLTKGELITKKSGIKTSVVKFQQYPWSPHENHAQYGARGQDEREMTLAELALQTPMNVTRDDGKPLPSAAQMRAEMHARLVHVLSLPALALLAIPLALRGRRRGQKTQGFVMGIIILVSYEKILSFGEALTASQTLSPWLSLWLPLTLMTGGTWFLIAKRTREIS